MAVVDSSALIAIMLREPEEEAIRNYLRPPRRAVIAAPTLLECNMVLFNRSGRRAMQEFAALVAALGIDVIPFTAPAALIASEAFATYGKGHGHRAQLNFGDCISYAVSKLEMMPLLFKGNDFRFTDVVCAL